MGNQGEHIFNKALWHYPSAKSCLSNIILISLVKYQSEVRDHLKWGWEACWVVFFLVFLIKKLWNQFSRIDKHVFPFKINTNIFHGSGQDILHFQCKIKIGSSFLLHIEITCKRISITAKLGEGIICCTQVLIVHYSPNHFVCVLGRGTHSWFCFLYKIVKHLNI